MSHRATGWFVIIAAIALGLWYFLRRKKVGIVSATIPRTEPFISPIRASPHSGISGPTLTQQLLDGIQAGAIRWQLPGRDGTCPQPFTLYVQEGGAPICLRDADVAQYVLETTGFGPMLEQVM